MYDLGTRGLANGERSTNPMGGVRRRLVEGRLRAIHSAIRKRPNCGRVADQPDGVPSGVHQTSPAVANQLNDFVRGRQPAGLLLGIDFLLFDENV